MKRKDWIIVFLPLVLVWYLDRSTKLWATNLQGLQSFGFIHFALHKNPGAMLGLFSNLPAVLRIVTLATGGAFLVVTYAIIQYLLPIRSILLRSGMSILLGGILGNVTDRILWGFVVDFIILGRVPDFISPAFNIADAVQWIGYGMIVYAVILEGEALWPEHNSRRKYWINPKFQLKYCYLLAATGLSIGLVSMVFCYTYMRVAMVDLIGPNQVVLDRFLIPFVITFGSIVLGFSAGLFALGKIISHKIAGPIFAFEKFMEDLFEANDKKIPIRRFKLRSRDEFKELETLAHSVKDKFMPGIEEIILVNANPSAEDETSEELLKDN